jgi:hypothetical protein
MGKDAAFQERIELVLTNWGKLAAAGFDLCENEMFPQQAN